MPGHLRFEARCVRVLSCLILTAFLLAPARGDDRVGLKFLGVVPGATSVEQLEQNREWGKPVYRTPNRDGTELLEYRIAGWREVIAVVKDGRVEVIDLTPEPYKPEELAEPLGLGRLEEIDELPPGALLGPPVPREWRSYVAGRATAVVFTADESGERVVKRLRFYAAPSATAAAPSGAATVATPAEMPTVSARIRMIGRIVAATLPKSHLTVRALDADVAARALELYLHRLDPQKLYFERQDVERFAAGAETQVAALKDGDLAFALEVANVFRRRIRLREAPAVELLREDLDFKADEYYDLNPPERFAAGDSEVRDRWRRYVKYLLLSKTSSGTPPSDVRDQVLRTLQSAHDRWNRLTEDDLAYLYLDALAQAFDPHSRFVSPENVETFRAAQQQQLVGIGVELRQADGFVVVHRIVPGGPADGDARLQPDTRILAVAQTPEDAFEDVSAASVGRVGALIQGNEGEFVVLRVLPAGSSEPATYAIKRAAVSITSVEGALLAGDSSPGGRSESIGYLRIAAFYRDEAASRAGARGYRSSAADSGDLLRKFAESRATVVVLDLRGNSGGTVVEAVDVAGLFFAGGPIWQVADRDGNVQVYDDPDAAAVWSGPLVVLTDIRTRGVAEIVAATIADRGRGLLVGDDRTYGTGVVGETLNLGDRIFQIPNAPQLGMLSVTNRQIYRITGVGLQRRGVAPHFVLPTVAALRREGEETLKYAVQFDRIPPAAKAESELSPDLVRTVTYRSVERQRASAYFQSLFQTLAAPSSRRVSLQEGRFSPPDRRPPSMEPAEAIPGVSRVKLDAWLKEALAVSADFAAAR